MVLHDVDGVLEKIQRESYFYFNNDEDSFKTCNQYDVPSWKGDIVHTRNASTKKGQLKTEVVVTPRGAGRLNGRSHSVLLDLMGRLEVPCMISHGTS